MDSGLRVQWPLSPYATALAAGALVGFCVALWKVSSNPSGKKREGPRGRETGDLDPPKKEAGDKKKNDDDGKKKKTDFPDVKPPDYGRLCASGAFGAIPRTVQGNRTPPPSTSQLYANLRRRFAERRSFKTWHEINPSSSNFSCIYQQSSLFGQEQLSRLNAKFVLNVSPYLSQYLRHFDQYRDRLQFPEFQRKGLFEDFDVGIHPEILKDRPLTRSALCLTLERQLHKILGQESCGVHSRPAAIQANAGTGNHRKGGVPALRFELESAEHHVSNETLSDESSSSLECSNLFSEDSSLWDSGYCEKPLDERWIQQRESDDDIRTSPLACSSVYSSSESSDTDTVLFVGKTPDKCDSNSQLGISLHAVNSESSLNSDSKDNTKSDLPDPKFEETILQSPLTPDLSIEEITTDLADMEPPTSHKETENNLSDDINSQSAENDSGINTETQTSSRGVSAPESDINESIVHLSSLVRSLDLEAAQNAPLSYEQDGQVCKDDREGSPEKQKDVGPSLEQNRENTPNSPGEDRADRDPPTRTGGLDGIQIESHGICGEPRFSLSAALKVEKARPPLSRDVTGGAASRDPGDAAARERALASRQMDRETGERSVALESSLSAQSPRLSASVVSRLTLDGWPEDSVSVRTTIREEVFRPTFEEFIPLSSGGGSRKSDESAAPKECGSPGSCSSLPSSPRVERLKGLIHRDEERRSRAKFQHLATGEGGGSQAAGMEGEWDRLLRDVLASVSELERWERRHCDVSSGAEDAEQEHPSSASQSDSSFAMEEEALSPGSKGETPTKVKSLRFKLDPDVFDVPSDDSFYDDEDENRWRTRYHRHPDEPVRLVSVHASVVPAGQKMVARPVGIDLRVRLTEERQSKRAHVGTSPSQAKRRSPVSERGWSQELSPVTENVDWREGYTTVNGEGKSPVPNGKTVPNGILKTPSPKSEPAPVESPNPFKRENGVKTNGVATNGLSPVIERKPIVKPMLNGGSWKPLEKKPLSLPRKKFEPDPEAIERITGYKSALSKPPLPPPIIDKTAALKIAAIKKAELARKQYLDNKAALSANKAVDGGQKFQQFVDQAQNDRARIVTSVPDLAAIERAVTEQWRRERASVSPRESPLREETGRPNGDASVSRGSTPDDKWASYVQTCRQHLGRRSQSMTYLETDIDIIPILDEDEKCVSTSALDESDEALPDPDDSDLDRSREDLDDSGRAKSEHELRIERSLRSLPLPDWYKRSDKPKSGFLLGSSTKEKRGWAAIKSLASSTSSLASCGLRRPVTSLRSSRENIPWSRTSSSPDGPALSLALAKAFREPYLGWRARTPTSSGVSSSPHVSPPSWNATTTDDEGNGVSFDGEDAFGRTTSSDDDRKPLSSEPLSLDDTGADAVTVSMDTNDPVKIPGGEDTCDDINNMSMDTCELFDASVAAPADDEQSPQADTGDSIDNLSTDTATENRKADPKAKRFSYSQSIYHSEWEEHVESRGDRKVREKSVKGSKSSSPDQKIVWIESSFVGSRTTTSIKVLPDVERSSRKAEGSSVQERPASR